MSDRRPPQPIINWQWFSVCSAHCEYDPDCGNCNAGSWVSEREQEFSNWLWNYSPRIWRKFANRDNCSMWREWIRNKVRAEIDGGK